MTIWSLLAGLCRVLGLADWAKQLYQTHEDTIAGMAKQRAADDMAALKEDKDAAKNRDSVDRLSDADLDAELRGDTITKP